MNSTSRKLIKYSNVIFIAAFFINSYILKFAATAVWILSLKCIITDPETAPFDKHLYIFITSLLMLLLLVMMLLDLFMMF